MQLTEKKAATRVKPVNRAAVVNSASAKLKDTPYYHLLLFLAEGCDANAGERNFYCTFGSIKDGSSLQLSIKLDGDGQTVYGGTLQDLASSCAAIHDAA